MQAIVKAAISFFIDLVMSMASKEFIKWLFFYVGRKVVETTKTTHDDAFFDKMQQNYEEYEKNK